MTTTVASTEQAALNPDELMQRWERVLRDPALRNLPFRLELNKWGHIEMTLPAIPKHMDLAASLMGLLREMLGGKALPECPIVTAGGVKVADVVWCSQAFLERHADEFRSWAAALSRAPDLCIEIKSPTNTLGELREKLQLYLDAGATEAWIVHPDGSVEIFHAPGARQGGAPGGSIFLVDLDRIRREMAGSARRHGPGIERFCWATGGEADGEHSCEQSSPTPLVPRARRTPMPASTP